MEQQIAEQYSLWTGKAADSIHPLPASGSHRKYYRIVREGKSVLGVYNDAVGENAAYFSFTQQFLENGLNVPKILHIRPDSRFYFVEDLGDRTLFSVLPSPWPEDFVHTEAYPLYLKVLDALIGFQTAKVEYRHVYPIAVFDRTAMMWDLNYFKYSFLKISGIEFSECFLENDFERLCRFLSQSPQQGFMYRDFQSRNIMVAEGEPWFIDFQGGRKGPIAYDLASLLYNARAELPARMREALLAEYVERASGRIANFDAGKFYKEFYACVLLRILQAMGAYGLRGIHEGKTPFLKSIPIAIRNLNEIIAKGLLPFEMPEIERILHELETSPWAEFRRPRAENLCVRLYSFSIRHDNPPFDERHGGGFVFDCRFLPNPGRLPEYKTLTGRDAAVVRYLEAHSEVSDFLQNCVRILKPAIRNYIERGFDTLCVSFGCTGGQHRSVYCAEKTAELLRQDFDINVEVRHLVHPA